MKQKCILSKKKNTLVIKEVAQTEPGSFSLLYETEVDNAVVEAAVESGQEAVMDMFRTHHFYPTIFFSKRIADGIIGMFSTEPTDSLHIEFNDVESLQSKKQEEAEPEKIENEKELAEIDNLLEDDDAFEIDIDPSAAATPAATTPAATEAGSTTASADDKPEA